jgi:hypothetical protein
MSTETTFTIRPLDGHGNVVFVEDKPADDTQVAMILECAARTMLLGDKARTQTTDAKPKAKGPLQLRAEALFKRRESTPLSPAEARAMKGARPCIVATSEEEWMALERFYAAPKEGTFRRHELAQLLNNWNGEVIKAVEWCKERNITFGQPAAAARPEDVEPEGWRDYLAKAYPGHDLHTGQWRSISRANRLDFIREIAASKAK